jgi:hypothetical protein
MSKKLPYEEKIEEILEGLPVPDENQSWEKMSKLLDGEKRRRRVLPIFFTGCLGLIISLLLLVVVGNLLLPPRTAITELYQNKGGESFDRKGAVTEVPVTEIKKTADAAPGIDQNKSHLTLAEVPRSGKVESPLNVVVKRNDFDSGNSIEQKKPGGRIKPVTVHQEKQNINNEMNSLVELHYDTENRTVGMDTKIVVGSQTTTNTSTLIDHESDSLNSVIVSLPLDSVQNVDSTSIATKSSINISFSGGIGIQQQIPFAGQGSVPYNYYGRRSSFADFLPSVFLRVHLQEKWFLMTEFRYGAPQFVKEFPYSRSSVYDASNMILVTTTMRLQKTYYHQLPVTFNYFLKPGFSIGAGMMYSRFAGAVFEKETKELNVLTLGEAVSNKQMNMKGFTDSFLYKTQMHMLIQSDFHYKRVIAGFRFTKDLQPYIKYTRPNGEIMREKNYSLQAILRYQLFK